MVTNRVFSGSKTNPERSTEYPTLTMSSNLYDQEDDLTNDHTYGSHQVNEHASDDMAVDAHRTVDILTDSVSDATPCVPNVSTPGDSILSDRFHDHFYYFN